MIEDSRTRVIVTQEHLRARLAELTPQGTVIVTPNDGHDAHGGPGDSGLAAAHPIPYQSHGPGGPPPAPAPSRPRTSSTPPAAPAGPRHTLVRVGDSAEGCPGLSVHFLGKRRAIEPVYRNNIQEVLEFETDHMVGVFEEVLPGYGLNIRPLGHEPSVRARLDVAAEDHYLGTFEIHPDDGLPRREHTEIYVQAHPGRVEGLAAGQYRW